jgi:hypothetical protein
MTDFDNLLHLALTASPEVYQGPKGPERGILIPARTVGTLIESAPADVDADVRGVLALPCRRYEQRHGSRRIFREGAIVSPEIASKIVGEAPTAPETTDSKVDDAIEEALDAVLEEPISEDD